jgi:hypothetical protein
VPQHGGPAVLGARDARDVRLPADLRAALREWSAVAGTVLRSGDDHELDLLRRRGRQLASRVADVLGRPVQFVDPVSGAVESVGGGRTANGAAATNGVAATDGVTANGAVASNGPAASYGVATGRATSTNGAGSANGVIPATGVAGASRTAGAAVRSGGAAGDWSAGSSDAVAVDPAWQPLALEPPGPTPWGTGMAVAAFFTVLVAVADVVLATAFGGAFGLLWVPANLLVTAGTMPSLWLAREVPFWRWPAFGAAAGLAAAWVVLLLGLLGP